MKLLFFATLLGWSVPLCAQQTTQERLGYPKDAKLLILHADDLGVSHSEDSASIYCLEKGDVSSASTMVPCPWFPEIAAYSAQHPDADIGVHLTLTSEWKYYKWGPVAPKDKVSSLLNKEGYFYDDPDSLGKRAKLNEVETELKSQIEKALHAGMHITHLDSHMGSVFFNKDFLKIYLKLAHEYHLPCLLNADAFKLLYHVDISDLITDKDVLTDHVYMAFPPSPEKDRAAYYSQLLRALQPGLNCIILHAAFNNDEMRAVTMDHPDYGAAWRQADFDFFTSDACKKLLADNHIYLITWKEIKDKLMK
ncbi:MAG TPA: polysaccharide deacetylase family protein [Chitinophagaceae bacterium]|nr:polysaccharide deacetylase family protein [Chitinophagaceae bacterium]